MGKRRINKRKEVPVVVPGQDIMRITPRQFQEMRRELIRDASEDALCKLLLVAGTVIMNNWGKLIRRKNRLRIFAEQFAFLSENVNNPTPEMLEVEAALKDMGLEIKR